MELKLFFVFAFSVTITAAGIASESHQIHDYHQEHHHQQLPNSQTDHHHAARYQNAPASLHHHVLVQKQQHKLQDGNLYEIDPHPQYKFSYDVQDSISGDSKSQVESRDGDVVHGEYSLNDADGFRRTVKYTASDANGFNAVVHREPIQHKTTAAAPEHHYHYVAPATHAAPSEVSKAPLVHEQHSSYATYETPKQNAHENYHQHH